MDSPTAYIQTWLILAVITYGLLAALAPGWSRSTRIALSAVAPLLTVVLVVIWAAMDAAGQDAENG